MLSFSGHGPLDLLPTVTTKTLSISCVTTQALVVSNYIGRDGLVGAEAAQRRSRAVGYLLEVRRFVARSMRASN